MTATPIRMVPTAAEYTSGAMEAVWRRRVSTFGGGNKGNVGDKKSTWDGEIWGRLGEMMVGKYLCFYAGASNQTYKNVPDVETIEVETVGPNRRLIFRVTDKDAMMAYVLVTIEELACQPPTFWLTGWYTRQEAQAALDSRSGVEIKSDGSMWVDRSLLHDMTELLPYLADTKQLPAGFRRGIRELIQSGHLAYGRLFDQARRAS